MSLLSRIIFVCLISYSLAIRFNCTRLDPPWMQFPGLCRIFEANFNRTDTEVVFSSHIENLEDEYEVIFMRSKPTFIPTQVFEEIPNLIGLEAQFSELVEIPDLTKAPRLRKLDLKENGIEQVRRGAFAGATSLSTVDLFRNKIKHIHPEAFFWLADLEYVFLGSNRIHNIDRNTFSRQTKLKTVDLRDNLIGGRFELVLYVVQKLDISGNRIRNVSLEATLGDDFPNDVSADIRAVSNDINKFQVLGDLSVEKLSLASNQFRTVESIQISKPKKIVSLDVSSNPFALISKQDLSQFSNVRSLNVANTSLSLGETNIFADLSLLRSLNLGYNGLKSFNLGFLRSFADFETLNLDGNELTHLLGIADLQPRGKPFRVSLFNNYFFCQDLRDIVSQLRGLNGAVVKRGDLVDNQLSGYNEIECFE